MKTERFLEAEKILQDAGIDYTLHSEKYITADKHDIHSLDAFDPEQLSENDPRLTLIAPDGFKDEADMYEALSYCGLYTGQ